MPIADEGSAQAPGLKPGPVAGEMPILLVALALVLALSLWPRLDLAASGWFIGADGHFAGTEGAFGNALDRVMDVVLLGARGLGVLLILATLAAWLCRRARGGWAARLARHGRALGFVCAVLVIGPGLLVNTLIKDHSGRARPVRVQPFGGPKQFTPAFVPASQCPANCSFVSGHAAFGAMPFAGMYLARSRRRRTAWMVAGYGGGILVGLGRMAAGAHFASDVLVALLIVRAVAWLCARWLLPAKAPAG